MSQNTSHYEARPLPPEDPDDVDVDIASSPMNTEEKNKIIGIILTTVCCIGILLLVILLPLSVLNVSHDEYAIRYDDLTKEIYSSIYTEGKYFYPPQTEFFKYSNLVKKLELEITCLTSNGIEVKLEVDVQYQIPKNHVLLAFESFGEEKRVIEYLQLILTDSILDSCGVYQAKHFYEDRLSIQNTLEIALIQDAKNSHSFFNITAAVLSRYTFPNELKEAIADKRAAENDIEFAQNEREGAVVEANTLLKTAIIEAEKLKIETDAEVNSILAEGNAKSLSVEQIWENRQNVYNNIMNAMNMTFEEFVFKYLESIIFLNADEPITALQ